MAAVWPNHAASFLRANRSTYQADFPQKKVVGNPYCTKLPIRWYVNLLHLNQESVASRSILATTLPGFAKTEAYLTAGFIHVLSK